MAEQPRLTPEDVESKIRQALKDAGLGDIDTEFHHINHGPLAAGEAITLDLRGGDAASVGKQMPRLAGDALDMIEAALGLMVAKAAKAAKGNDPISALIDAGAIEFNVSLANAYATLALAERMHDHADALRGQTELLREQIQTAREQTEVARLFLAEQRHSVNLGL